MQIRKLPFISITYSKNTTRRPLSMLECTSRCTDDATSQDDGDSTDHEQGGRGWCDLDTGLLMLQQIARPVAACEHLWESDRLE